MWTGKYATNTRTASTWRYCQVKNRFSIWLDSISSFSAIKRIFNLIQNISDELVWKKGQVTRKLWLVFIIFFDIENRRVWTGITKFRTSFHGNRRTHPCQRDWDPVDKEKHEPGRRWGFRRFLCANWSPKHQSLRRKRVEQTARDHEEAVCYIFSCCDFYWSGKMDYLTQWSSHIYIASSVGCNLILFSIDFSW